MMNPKWIEIFQIRKKLILFGIWVFTILTFFFPLMFSFDDYIFFFYLLSIPFFTTLLLALPFSVIYFIVPKIIICPNCGMKIQSRKKINFCMDCGARIYWNCPSCKEKVSIIAKFCQMCGYNLTPDGLSQTIKPPKQIVPIDGHCGECGTKINIDTKFCYVCGAEF